MLLGEAFPVKYLEELKDGIRKHYPTERLDIEIDTSHCLHCEPISFIVHIVTKDNAEIACDKMDKFDNDFYLNYITRVKDKVTIHFFVTYRFEGD